MVRLGIFFMMFVSFICSASNNSHPIGSSDNIADVNSGNSPCDTDSSSK